MSKINISYLQASNKQIFTLCKNKLSILFLIISSLLGFLIILLTTSIFNAEVTPDSVLYISVARNIAEGRGITTWHGTPLITEPPFFPLLLALVKVVFNIDPVDSSRIVQAIIFGLIVFFSGKFFYKYLSVNKCLWIISLIIVMIQPALIKKSLMILPDLLFILCTLLFLLFFSNYVENQKINSLIGISIFTSLSTLTKYTGLFLILFTVAFFFTTSHFRLNKVRWRYLALYLIISTVPIMVYLIRNLYLSGSLIGYSLRSTEDFSLSLIAENSLGLLRDFSESFFSWFFNPLISFGFVILLIGIAIGFSLRYKEIVSNRIIFFSFPFYVVLFIFTYTISLFLTLVGRGHFEERYLLPIFIPTVLLLVIYLERHLYPLIKDFAKQKTIPLIITLAVLFLIYPIRYSISTINQHLSVGAGYTGAKWKNSDTLNFLYSNNLLDQGYIIYTNATDVLYFFQGIRTDRVPNKEYWGSNGIDDIQSLKSIWPSEEKSCIIWFSKLETRDYLFTPEELMLIVDYEDQFNFEDGSIYFLLKH